MSSAEAERPDILFMCVANSARSQLAEGLARAAAPVGRRVHSAGSEPGRLHPLAIAVLAEIDIDISEHFSKSVDEVPVERIGTVITLCQEEVCPTFPGSVRRLHWPFPDPAGPTQGNDGEAVAQFRAVRDGIRLKLRELFNR